MVWKGTSEVLFLSHLNTFTIILKGRYTYLIPTKGL